MPGFPIQTSPGQRILGSSPRLFAAYHVFHRLPVPRHPPIALLILVFFTNTSTSVLKDEALMLPFLPYSIVKDQTGEPASQAKLG